MKWWLLPALVLLEVGGANAEGPLSTGASYFSACVVAQIVPESTCQAYLMGVHDAIIAHDSQWQGKKPTICLPPGFTYQQGYRMLGELMALGPTVRDGLTVNLYTAVLWANYSCSVPRPSLPLPPLPKP